VAQYPPFLEELRHPENRPRLIEATISGYVMVGAFWLLAWLADATGTFPYRDEFTWFLVAKFVANCGLWAVTRWDRFLIEVSVANVVADLVVMTGAIWVTGGPRSPLFAIYIIEIAVIGLTTNTASTVLTGALAMLLYLAMTLAVGAGWVPAYASPVEHVGGVDWGYRVADIGRAVLIIGATMALVSLLVKKLREREKVLEARTEALIDASAQKSRFLTNITHELRTPVHGISGLAEMVEMGVYGPITDKQREAMASIQANARQQLALIDDLLTLSRAEAGTLEVKLTEVDVEEVVRGAVGNLRGMLDIKALSYAVEVEGALPVIQTDRGKLVQVLINLIGNAVKFTPSGGSVVLRVRADQARHVVIEVADTGIGIAPEEQTQVFEEFRQLDDAVHTREYGGVGLGLPLVKRLVELLGGSVRLTSEVGVGTTLFVSLPVEPA